MLIDGTPGLGVSGNRNLHARFGQRGGLGWVREMPLSCEEYRHQQQLLALKRRLAENKLDPEEREEIERLVRVLERRLKM